MGMKIFSGALAVALFVSVRPLVLPPLVGHGIANAFTVIGFWQLGYWVSTAVVAWLSLQNGKGAQGALASSLGILGFLLRLVIWTLIFLLTLDNLGVDITTLVAGLGIGGLAIALAVQSILGDLFASLSIALDRPFVVGDFIVLGDFLGTVEAIGIKSTRVRSLGGEQIILGNSDLLNSRVRNYGRMSERRVQFSVGVTYETPEDVVRKIPGLIRQIIDDQDGVRFDRAHFAKFGDFALEFETVYYVLSSDYNVFMDTQQEIYFALLTAFAGAGIEFAYPTQKLWMAGVPAATNVST